MTDAETPPDIDAIIAKVLRLEDYSPTLDVSAAKRVNVGPSEYIARGPW